MAAVIAEASRIQREACGPPALFPQAPTHYGRLDPRSISVPLPAAWTTPLDRLRGPKRSLQRGAAILLVQMARGGSRLSAARYLGIPPRTLESTTLVVRAWQKQPGNADTYQAALHTIAQIAMGTSGSEPEP